MAKAKQLEKEAEAEIKVLKAQGETHLAEALRKEELNLKKLYSELVATEDRHLLQKIEHEVAMAENRLKDHIDRAHHHKASTPAQSSTPESKATSETTSKASTDKF